MGLCVLHEACKIIDNFRGDPVADSFGVHAGLFVLNATRIRHCNCSGDRY